MAKHITKEEAQQAIDAVRGDKDAPIFAKNHAKEGDVALILRKDGGMEILSVMPDNPTSLNVHSLALRGLFAIALFRLAQNADLMQAALNDANDFMEANEKGASKLAH